MCTSSWDGVHNPRGKTTGGLYLLGGCTWSRGGVPGPRGFDLVRGVYLVPGVYCLWNCTCLGDVPGPGGCTWSQGVYLVWGVYLVTGGCTKHPGVYLVLGGVPGPGGTICPGIPPPVNRMTNRCKNITLPQTSFAEGKYMVLQR